MIDSIEGSRRRAGRFTLLKEGYTTAQASGRGTCPSGRGDRAVRSTAQRTTACVLGGLVGDTSWPSRPNDSIFPPPPPPWQVHGPTKSDDKDLSPEKENISQHTPSLWLFEERVRLRVVAHGKPWVLLDL